MNTREILVFKTLAWKQTLGGFSGLDLVDPLLDQNPEHADTLTKNVCARVPIQLAQDMEAIGGMLDLNKREIITMALRDFLDKAKSLVDEYDAWPLPDDGEE